MFDVTFFSEGKEEPRNEDSFGNNDHSFVIVDGATDKSGNLFDGKTGGEIISEIIVQECLSTTLVGEPLVVHLNEKVKQFYADNNLSEIAKEPKYRFAASFIFGRISDGKLILTYLGDLGYRINAKEIYQEIKQIDIENSKKRAEYIEKTGDVQGGRDNILPSIVQGINYQNSSEEPKGYGVIDGTKTPSKYIKVFEYNLSDIQTLELFTDGYLKIPSEVSIDAWEESYKQVEEEDPYKWKNYKSTKAKDDRTIAILKFS